MNEINLSAQGNETAKAAYEKPAMCVYELEVEGAILQASGNPGGSTQMYGESDDELW